MANNLNLTIPDGHAPSLALLMSTFYRAGSMQIKIPDGERKHLGEDASFNATKFKGKRGELARIVQNYIDRGDRDAPRQVPGVNTKSLAPFAKSKQAAFDIALILREKLITEHGYKPGTIGLAEATASSMLAYLPLLMLVKIPRMILAKGSMITKLH